MEENRIYHFIFFYLYLFYLFIFYLFFCACAVLVLVLVLLCVEENRIYLAALSRRRIGHAASQINAAIVATWPDTSG